MEDSHKNPAKGRERNLKSVDLKYQLKLTAELSHITLFENYISIFDFINDGLSYQRLVSDLKTENLCLNPQQFYLRFLTKLKMSALSFVL